MKPDQKFIQQPKHFWANVRSISEKLGYTARKTRQILVPTLDQMTQSLGAMNLKADHVY